MQHMHMTHRSMLKHADIVLLDEPTNHLDQDGGMAGWMVDLVGRRFHCPCALMQKKSLGDCGLMIILPYL